MHYNGTYDNIYDELANVFPFAYMGIDKVTLIYSRLIQEIGTEK